MENRRTTRLAMPVDECSITAFYLAHTIFEDLDNRQLLTEGNARHASIPAHNALIIVFVSKLTGTAIEGCNS